MNNLPREILASEQFTIKTENQEEATRKQKEYLAQQIKKQTESISLFQSSLSQTRTHSLASILTAILVSTKQFQPEISNWYSMFLLTQ